MNIFLSFLLKLGLFDFELLVSDLNEIVNFVVEKRLIGGSLLMELFFFFHKGELCLSLVDFGLSVGLLFL